MTKKMTNNQKLRLALPTGSLNDPERGNTEGLLLKAGYDITGYTPKRETPTPRICNDSELELLIDRSKDIPLLMARGRGDAGILGLDLYTEAGIDIVPVCDLNYGRVRIVAAVSSSWTNESMWFNRKNPNGVGLFTLFNYYSDPKNGQLTCSTEYPRIALEWLTRGAKEFAKPSRYADGMLPSEPILVTSGMKPEGWYSAVIYPSAGKTELKVYNGLADLVVEATQTGNGLRQAGLMEIEEVMVSTAWLFASKPALHDPWKREKIEYLGMMLQGASRDDSFAVVMNVSCKDLTRVVSYLMESGYCGKMPTVSEEIRGYRALEVLIRKSDYPVAVVKLLRLGADDIINRNTGQVIRNTAFPALEAYK